MKKNITILIFLLFCITTLFAQNNNFVIGLLLNHKTSKPIPFATIYWKGEHFGCISNEDGTFKLLIDDLESEEILIIRSVGYETNEIPLRKINPNKLTTFTLHEKTYSLDEVSIKGKKLRPPSPKEIVRIAINNISENYPQNPFLLEGYYRDYIKIDSQYINMYESFIELEDYGFLESDYETTKIKQIYGRINSNFLFDTLKVMDYSAQKLKRIPSGEMGFKGGNELSILRLSDPIRNHERNNFDFINYLKTDFIANHYFHLKNIIKENDKYFYVLEFRYLKKVSADLEVGSRVSLFSKKGYYPKANADGLIYIENDNYTIKKIIYTLHLEDRKFGKLRGWELNLEYKDFKNKAYLNYISYNNVFEIPNYNDSIYFYLKNVHVHNHFQRISLEFNNELKPEIVDNLNSFKVKFKNENVDFFKAEIDTVQKNFVHLYANNNEFKKKFADFKPEMAYLLEVILPKNIFDINGNKLNKYESVLGYQYREFFVQNIKLDYLPLKQGECIDKWKSLINYKTSNFSDSSEVFFNSPLLYKSEDLKLLK